MVNVCLACRAGLILASKCAVFSWRKLRPPSVILMRAEGWERKNFVPRGWSTVRNKERGRGRGMKFTPARGH